MNLNGGLTELQGRDDGEGEEERAEFFEHGEVCKREGKVKPQRN